MDQLEETSLRENNGKDLLVKTIQSLSDLREVIVNGLESGLRNDAPDAAIAMRQKVRSISASTLYFFKYKYSVLFKLDIENRF